MKKSIRILLVLTASLALVPSLTLAQDAPTEEGGAAPAPETPATETPATETPATDDGAPAEPTEVAPVETEESAPAEAAPATESSATGEGEGLAAPTLDEDLEAEAAAQGELAEGEEAAEGEEEAAEEAPAAPPGVPLFRGSMFSWTQGVSFATMAPGLLLTYNPSYYWSFFFQPRINLDAQNFFVLSLGMSVEWTNNDFTKHEREPQLSDTSIEYRHLERWEGFIFLPSVRLTAPTSLPSISAERILNLGAGLTVVRVFPEAANLTLAVTGRYQHWFALSNVQTRIDDSRFPTAGGTFSDQVGFGGATERDRFLAALTMTVMPVAGLTVTTQYAFAWILAHDLAPAMVGNDLVLDQSATHWRNAQYFTLAVAYDVQPWLNISIGYQTAPGFARTLDDDGEGFSSDVNPLWDSSQSELYLSVTVPLDALYEAIAPSDGEEQLTPEQLQRRRQGLAQRGGPALSF